ncbi:hypothetical protein DXB17_10790 [Ruminococcus sp. OM02-16LB]|nr:hypothetical protein DXB17_10790 [Ruminococcus sp. OM02-16LB]
MICILSCYCIRACLKNHSHNLHAPLCGIFHLNSVAVVRACLENHSHNLYAPPYGTFINKYYFIIAKCKSFVNRKHWN